MINPVINTPEFETNFLFQMDLSSYPLTPFQMKNIQLEVVVGLPIMKISLELMVRGFAL